MTKNIQNFKTNDLGLVLYNCQCGNCFTFINVLHSSPKNFLAITLRFVHELSVLDTAKYNYMRIKNDMSGETTSF